MATFKKAAVFTDLHLGAKGNSPVHNQDCVDFIDWYIDQAKQNDCETGIFSGDFHHNRNNINIATLNTSINILEKLGKEFEQFFFLTGNHDLYYKDRRDIHSIAFGSHINGITIVDDILEYKDVAFVPWMIGNEWKRVQKISSPVVFGHFELANFYMNAQVKMPDTGLLKSSHFSEQQYVFSGHFHKRQHQGKIHYIGNAFPHNYADAWDDHRGMMIFDLEKMEPPHFIDWTDCPKYRTIELSRLIDKPESVIKSKTHLRVSIDLDISYEEASYIKETFAEKYGCREISLVQQRNTSEVSSDLEISQFESVDKIITEEINHIESDSFDNNVLLDIYKDL